MLNAWKFKRVNILAFGHLELHVLFLTAEAITYLALVYVNVQLM